MWSYAYPYQRRLLARAVEFVARTPAPIFVQAPLCVQATYFVQTDKTGRRRKPFISPEQFNLLVDFVQEPYSTMIFAAAWTGLRVSELIGLKWRCIHADSITIEERFCRGDWSVPKTQASAATIGVSPEVIARILRLKNLTVEVRAGRAIRKYKLVKSDDPDALVFQSAKDGKPMNDQNMLKRHIQPAARKLGHRL